jgi:hypothetical protein
MVSILGWKRTLADKTVAPKWIDWYKFWPNFIIILQTIPLTWLEQYRFRIWLFKFIEIEEQAKSTRNTYSFLTDPYKSCEEVYIYMYVKWRWPRTTYSPKTAWKECHGCLSSQVIAWLSLRGEGLDFQPQATVAFHLLDCYAASPVADALALLDRLKSIIYR